MKQLDSAFFTDEFETAGILSDEGLVERIREGTKQAKAKKGRFVE